MKTDELIAYIEKTADPKLALNWDYSGVQIAGNKSSVQRLAVALDPVVSTIKKAISWEADFILTHHPLSLSPDLPCRNDSYNKVLRLIFNSGSWLYAAHTSLDVQTKGPVSWLAQLLGLQNIQPVEPISAPKKVKLIFPPPSEQKSMALKLQRQIQQVTFSQSPEIPMEVVCTSDNLDLCLNLIREHCPGAEVETRYLLDETSTIGFGIIGDLTSALTLQDCLQELGNICPGPPLALAGSWIDNINRIAYCPGSGMSLAFRAFEAGAQVFISGDLKFHQAQEIEAHGLVVDVGHFALEEKMMDTWSEQIINDLDRLGIQVKFFPGHNPFWYTKDLLTPAL